MARIYLSYNIKAKLGERMFPYWLNVFFKQCPKYRQGVRNLVNFVQNRFLPQKMINLCSLILPVKAIFQLLKMSLRQSKL